MSSVTRQQGVTLIELVFFIIIMGVVMSGVLTAMVASTQSSTDPLIMQQGISIAESYMEEILSKPFLDPYSVTTSADINTVPVCPTAPSERRFYDNVCDYKGNIQDAVVSDQFDAPITGLESFSVTVTIDETKPWDIDAAHEISAGNVISVVVTVKHESFGSLSLKGYRTRYGYS
jgi:MSHA pilin protein MshD